MSYGQGDLTGGGSFNGEASYTNSYQNSGRSTQADFTRLTQLISSNILKIQQNVKDIRRMVEQLGSPQDSSELRDKLHQRQHYTNQLSKDTAKYLKDVRSLPCNSSEQKLRKTQTDRLMSDFSDHLNSFQSVQRDAATKEKESIARARAASSNADNDGALVNIHGFQEQQQATVNVEDMEDIEERQDAIRQLESDIMDLNEIFKDLGSMVEEQGLLIDIIDVNMIFKDLGTMVHDQGEMIDSIEANVATAADQVESGNVQLGKAREHRTSARKKKLICLIIVVVAVIILALIIYFSTQN